jgi:peptidyl-prolyl cis-trans isomerase D|uniref:Periplasmic chaperone PpiD n=1 Tax=Desulfobacca acetoxidans TaxID=60893 RepID=A0A7C5ALX4_9BACT
MLNFLRKYSRHWVIAVIIGAIVVVFIFWGIGGFKSPQAQEIAWVYDQPISMATYVQYLTILEKKTRFRRELREEDYKALREQAPDNLIRLTLLTETAKRWGLTVSDAEVRAAILQDPDFHNQGAFDPRLYDQFVGKGRLRQFDKADFERWVRLQLLAAKVVEAVTAFAKVSEAELQEFHRVARETVQVDFLVVSPEAFLSRVHPSETELKEYYDKHQDEFRTPEKVKVHYVVCRAEDFRSQVKLTSKDLEDYVSEHRRTLVRPQSIRAREIFLAFPPKAGAAERQMLEKKAQELKLQALRGEDFAQLAQAHSQDAATAKRGGDLGVVKRGQKPPAWEKVAFALEPGQIGLASTDKGLHLIRLEDIKESAPLPEAEAKAWAKEKLSEARSRDLAREEAKRLAAEMAATSFTATVQKHQLTSTETPFFSQTEPVPGLGEVRAFAEEAFRLRPREVGLAEIPQGTAILQLLDRKPAGQLTLAQARERVQQAVARQKAQTLAAEEAEKLLARLRRGEPLARVAAQAALPLRDSGPFTRVQGFLNQPLAEAITTTAFQLSEKQPYPDKPVFWQGKYYLLAFRNRRAPAPEEFQKDRDTLARRLLEEKRRLLLEAWLTEEWQRARVRKAKHLAESGKEE